MNHIYFIFLPFLFGCLANLAKNGFHLGCCHTPLTLLAGCLMIGSKSLCLSMTIHKILFNIFDLKLTPISLSILSTYLATLMI